MFALRLELEFDARVHEFETIGSLHESGVLHRLHRNLQIAVTRQIFSTLSGPDI
jgi:hypothetical protein